MFAIVLKGRVRSKNRIYIFIPNPHHFAFNLAYVRWTSLIPATNYKRDSHVGLVYEERSLLKGFSFEVCNVYLAK